LTDALQGKDDLSVECGLLAFVRNERILIFYRKTKPYLLWFTKNGVFLMSLESIEQQKEKIAQQKAKLLQKEKELKDQERKLLTKRKIELNQTREDVFCRWNCGRSLKSARNYAKMNPQSWVAKHTLPYYVNKCGVVYDELKGSMNL